MLLRTRRPHHCSLSERSRLFVSIPSPALVAIFEHHAAARSLSTETYKRLGQEGGQQVAWSHMLQAQGDICGKSSKTAVKLDSGIRGRRYLRGTRGKSLSGKSLPSVVAVLRPSLGKSRMKLD